MNTTKEIKEFFDQNGYYLAKDVYSSDEIESMESDFDRIVGQLSSGDDNINARWGSRWCSALDAPRQGRWRTAVQTVRQCRVLRAVAAARL